MPLEGTHIGENCPHIGTSSSDFLLEIVRMDVRDFRHLGGCSLLPDLGRVDEPITGIDIDRIWMSRSYSSQGAWSWVISGLRHMSSDDL